MKTMVFTDLITTKNSLLTLLGIDVVLGVFLTFTMQTLIGGLAAMCVIVPFMFLFSISAYDEMGGWERFRLTLPVTRRQVAFGRYASLFITLAAAVVLTFVVGHVMVMIGDAVSGAPVFITSQEVDLQTVCAVVLTVSVVILLTAAITLPFIMRFGMTKATRILPVVIVLVLALGIAATGDIATSDALATAFGWAFALGPDATDLLAVAALAVALLLYIASAFVSAKLYEKREF